MGADNSAHIIDDHGFHAAALLRQLRHIAGILNAIAVGDENGAVFAGQTVLLQLLHQCLQRVFAAAALGNGNQVAFLIHMEHRLDIQHGANHGCGSADASAPLQEHQVVHGEPVADVQLVFLTPGVQLFQGEAFIALHAGIVYEKALAQGGGKGIHHLHSAAGVFLHQLLGGDDGGLIGGAEAAGEGKHQCILTVFQNGLHSIPPALGVHGGGGCGFALAQGIIHGFDLRLGRVDHFFAPEQQGHLHNINIQRGDQLLGQIAAGIGNNSVSCHESTLLEKIFEHTIPHFGGKVTPHNENAFHRG